MATAIHVRDVQPRDKQEWTADDSPTGSARGATPSPAVHPAAFIGNPAPLGLLGFGMTTCFLMFLTTTWAEAATVSAIMSYAFAYGGLAQIIAGIFELIKGNTFAGTAFTSYGCFWLAFFLSKYITTAATGAAGHPAFTAAHGVGETLIMAWWAVFTGALAVCTLRKNLCLLTVFSTLTLTFALLAGGQWSATCNKAAGYVGFICGCSAIYTAFAEVWHENLGIIAPGLRPVRFI